MAMDELAQRIKTIVESPGGATPEDLAVLAAQRAGETANELDTLLEGSDAREGELLVARYRWAADHIGQALKELRTAKGHMEALFVHWGVDVASMPDTQYGVPAQEVSTSAPLVRETPVDDDDTLQLSRESRYGWTAEDAIRGYQQYMGQRGSILPEHMPFYIAPEGEPIVRLSDRDLLDPAVQQELDAPIETVVAFPDMDTDNPRKKPLGRVQKYGVFSVRDALILGSKPFETWGVRVEPADADAQLQQVVPDVHMEHPGVPLGPAKAAQLCERLDQVPIQVLNPRLESDQGRITLADILDPETGMPKVPPAPSEHKTRIKLGLPKGYGYREYEAAVAYVREFRRVRRYLTGTDTA